VADGVDHRSERPIVSEEKRKGEADEERPPERDEPISAAERRSQERRAARERAAKAREAKPKKAGAKSERPSPKARPVSKARERREREARGKRPAPPPRRRPAPRKRYVRPEGPGPARLYALAAGAFLTLLGVLGFFYDASFDTGADLKSDDLAGILMVNGWRNVVYLVTGLAALSLAGRRPRATAAGLGLLYLVYAVWGFIVTERDIGDILGFLPLSDEDNVLHLLVGALGLLAALVDGPLPALPAWAKPKLPKRRPRKARRKAPAKRPTARKPEKKEGARARGEGSGTKDGPTSSASSSSSSA
jgi:hypothetical protein